MRTFILLSILTLVAGCTAEQATRTQQIGADIAAGRPIVVTLNGATTQPSELTVPTSVMPYKEIIGSLVTLAGIAAGMFVHARGSNQGAEQALTVPENATK